MGIIKDVEFTRSDLLNKKKVMELLSEHLTMLLKTAVGSFYEESTDPADAFIQSSIFILELVDAGIVTENESFILGEYTATLYTENSRKGVNRNDKKRS